MRLILKSHIPNHKVITSLLLLIVANNIYGQQPIKYDFFYKPPLGQIQINLPQPATFSPVDVNHSMQQSSPLIQTSPTLNNDNLVEQQNQRILQQSNMLPGQATNSQQVQQMAGIERDLMETNFYKEQMEWLAKTKSYRQAYDYLLQLNPDSFSITKAVFAVENAYMDNKLSYDELTKALKERADLVKQILKREGLNSKNNLAANYGIQKLFSQQNMFYSAQYHKSILVPSIKYDFDDFMGEKDYTKMFVYKLLATGKVEALSKLTTRRRFKLTG